MSGRIDVAVVGRERDVEALAGAAASMLAARASGRAAVVVRTSAGRPRRLAPPTRGAARLSERLSARGLEPVSSGRVAWCPGRSALDVSRAGVGAPVVLAVCCAREPWIEPLLDGAGLVLVAARDDDVVAELALDELRARGISCAPALVPEGAASLLARSGLWAGASLRELIEREGVPV